MNKIEIINRIGYFRTRAKLSQKALSIDIDMNVGYINRLECKKDFLPSLETLIKIVDACGITIEEFFYSKITDFEKDKQFIEKYKSVPHDKIEALIKYEPEFIKQFVNINSKLS